MDNMILTVCAIAKLAGEKILEIYNASEGVKIEKKADNSPLTIADKEANKIICDGLENLDVQYPIISEENKLVDYSSRANYEYAWMVDPLDGTKEFINRNGEFTVNIALIHNGVTVAGVVYVPCTEVTYYAIKGKGAFKIENDNKQVLKCNTFNMNDENLKVVCSRSHLNPETQEFMDKLSDPEKVSKGSSLKFLILAEGKADLYPRLAPTMEWDTAAAHIILEEAGGQVLNAETNTPLAYNKENLLNPFFIASGTII